MTENVGVPCRNVVDEAFGRRGDFLSELAHERLPGRPLLLTEAASRLAGKPGQP